MRRLFQTAIIFAVLVCPTSAALACTCVEDPLGKRYRKAKAVFVGQAVDPSGTQPAPSLVQGDRQQTIAVIKSWKGINKRFVSLSFDLSVNPGMCPTLFFLQPGKQYLVFAYGKNLEVTSVCPDTWEIPKDKNALSYEIMQSSLKKLDSFWFRFWSRLKV